MIVKGENLGLKLSKYRYFRISLTIKPTSDPLRVDPIAHVNNGCVGCGLCGEVAHAASLCPSFYKAEKVQNPGKLKKLTYNLRHRVISAMFSE